MKKPTGKVKLTKPMKTVLRLMGSGWELGSGTGSMDGPPFLQKGGVGYGGDTAKTNWNTIGGLLDRKLIVQHYKFPTATYSLTPLGHRALKVS
ncbi:MAG: hypothetical protein J3T61_11735 [Candidatus Brocadiales bacterium]|nr:hypothetical protein [Candidatus Bathyanammoxibius sp.]